MDPSLSISQPNFKLGPPLAFIAGFVDTTGYVTVAGVFFAHVTGNFVMIGASVAGINNVAIATKLLVFPVFIAAIALGWLIQQRSGERALSIIARTECIALIACALAGVARETFADYRELATASVLLFGVSAMGLQSIVGRIAQIPMTTVMTGNVTQLTIKLLDYASGRARGAKAPREATFIVLAFAAGALAAGLSIPRFGMAVFCVPAVLMCILCLTQMPVRHSPIAT